MFYGKPLKYLKIILSVLSCAIGELAYFIFIFIFMNVKLNLCKLK